MNGIPGRFRAFVAERRGEDVERGVRAFSAESLSPGEIDVGIEYSSVNYKDGLATVANGRVARISPLIPGIDMAGTVVASRAPAIAVGTAVLAHGYEIGVSHHGGYAEYGRVPADWVVPLAPGFSARDAMSVGTAGFTAAMSVVALEARGLTPDDGPVLVTGASGGVGGTAVSILLDRGYEVWAVTGKPDLHERLRARGVAGILSREEVATEGRPLEAERWAGAVDAVGSATLPYILRTLREGAAVAASGNASGPALVTTVFPFILRGCVLLGMDSAHVPIAERREIWDRIATDLRPSDLGERVTEVGLDDLSGALDAILAGRATGRWLVRTGG